MKLRNYQQDAVDAVAAALTDNASTLVVMPTGTGKTIMFGHVADWFANSGRVLVLAHREELIFQAAEKLEAITRIKPDIEMADYHADQDLMYGRAKIIVSSIQTQIAGRNGGRMTKFRPDDFSLVIVDEAHHAPAASYQRVLEHYRQNPRLKVLGVTATPDRHDEEALGQIFESVAFNYGILDAIDGGWLVPIRQQFIQVTDLDFSAVRTTAGDLNGGDLAHIMEQESILHGIADPTIRIAGGRRTLVFAASVLHAELLTDIFNRHTPESARIVTGKTPKDDRRAMLTDYAADRFQFLVNVGVATEGFDSPGIQLVSVARPTKSRALYAQMIGRATRPLPSIVDGLPDAAARKAAIGNSAKTGMIVLDFVGNSGRHKLITTADVLGGNYSDAIVARAERIVKEAGTDADMITALAEARHAEREEQARAEREKRRQIKGRATYTTTDVNAFDVLDIEALREPGWHKGRKPSTKMTNLLDKFGLKDTDKLSFHQAHQLIDALLKRRNEELCTYKQARFLQKPRYGYDTSEMSFAEAGEIITAIKENGWQPIRDMVAEPI